MEPNKRGIFAEKYIKFGPHKHYHIFDDQNLDRFHKPLLFFSISLSIKMVGKKRNMNLFLNTEKEKG